MGEGLLCSVGSGAGLTGVERLWRVKHVTLADNGWGGGGVGALERANDATTVLWGGRVPQSSLFCISFSVQRPFLWELAPRGRVR